MNLSKRSLHHGKEDNTVRVPLSIRIKNVTMICRDKPPVPVRYMTTMKSSKSNCYFIFTSLFLEQNKHNRNYNTLINNHTTYLFSYQKLLLNDCHDKTL